MTKLGKTRRVWALHLDDGQQDLLDEHRSHHVKAAARDAGIGPPTETTSQRRFFKSGGSSSTLRIHTAGGHGGVVAYAALSDVSAEREVHRAVKRRPSAAVASCAGAAISLFFRGDPVRLLEILSLLRSRRRRGRHRRRRQNGVGRQPVGSQMDPSHGRRLPHFRHSDHPVPEAVRSMIAHYVLAANALLLMVRLSVNCALA